MSNVELNQLERDQRSVRKVKKSECHGSSWAIKRFQDYLKGGKLPSITKQDLKRNLEVMRVSTT